VITATPEAIYKKMTRLILTHTDEGLAPGGVKELVYSARHKCARYNYIKDLR
jgi:hypothetical protein